MSQRKVNKGNLAVEGEVRGDVVFPFSTLPPTGQVQAAEGEQPVRYLQPATLEGDWSGDPLDWSGQNIKQD